MARTLNLGDHLVPAILELLGTKAALPSEGILAGQALSSAIAELHGAAGVYNDVDVFVLASEHKRAELMSRARMEEDALKLGLPLAALDNYRTLGLVSNASLDILGSDTDGPLNLVWCETTSGSLSPSQVVHSFDLNAVEVALDLKSRELTWSPAFEHFLRHNELEVTSLATPERTLLRYLKKRRELAAYGNDQLVKDMTACWLETTWMGEVNVLGSRMVALFRDHENELRNHFVLAEFREEKPLPSDPLPPAWLRVKPRREGPYLQRAPGWTRPPGVEDLLARAVSEHNETEGAVRLVPRLFYQQARHAPRAATQEAQDVCAQYEKKEDGKPSVCGFADLFYMSAKLIGGAYLAGPRGSGQQRVVLHALKNHPDLAGALFGLSLDEQYRCVLDLRRRATTAGEHIWGLVEADALPVDMWNQHHRDQFFRRINREETSTLLGLPLFQPFEEGGWTIKELLTRRALRIEGAELAHCVGGYASAVSAGRSRLLSVRSEKGDPGDNSTVELSASSLEAGRKVIIRQHRSRSNRDVSDAARAAVRRFLEREGARLGFLVPSEAETVEEADADFF